ncbi:MAG: alpha-amylase, partial [Ignavibacteriales bacterium]|nr:alpha-amylase [Ignavibacteriales bacterium]
MKITLSKFPSLSGKPLHGFPRFEFHIHADMRKKYQVDEALFTTTGNVILPDFRAVRMLTHKINAQRDLKKHPEQAIKPGQLNAMGLIDEIYHYILRVYEETANPKVFARAVADFNRSLGDNARTLLQEFGSLFPPLDVYRGRMSLEQYLGDRTEEKEHTELALEELILLYFANFNTAFTPFKELFDDGQLKDKTA